MKKGTEIQLAKGKLGVLTPGNGGGRDDLRRWCLRGSQWVGKTDWLLDTNGNDQTRQTNG